MPHNLTQRILSKSGVTEGEIFGISYKYTPVVGRDICVDNVPCLNASEVDAVSDPKPVEPFGVEYKFNSPARQIQVPEHNGVQAGLTDR
jgi:hypothetical protein